jgi:hypothetical protein
LIQDLEVREIEAHPGRPVLVTFISGEEYLAAGFKMDTPELAQFVNDAGLDERVDLIHTYLKALPSDIQGPLCWPGFQPDDPVL